MNINRSWGNKEEENQYGYYGYNHTHVMKDRCYRKRNPLVAVHVLLTHCGFVSCKIWSILFSVPKMNYSQIAKFMGPTWGPPGSYRPQMGPILAPWTLLSGLSMLTSRKHPNEISVVKDFNSSCGDDFVHPWSRLALIQPTARYILENNSS